MEIEDIKALKKKVHGLTLVVPVNLFIFCILLCNQISVMKNPILTLESYKKSINLISNKKYINLI
jgi:hypothetical protein